MQKDRNGSYLVRRVFLFAHEAQEVASQLLITSTLSRPATWWPPRRVLNPRKPAKAGASLVLLGIEIMNGHDPRGGRRLSAEYQ